MDKPIARYLEDAIAAEKNFETQLQGFAKEAEQREIKSLFEQHARETKDQYEALTERLKALGGSPSTLKSMLAHLFGGAPKMGQMGHEATERTTQNLIMAFAVETAEVAMYEALCTAAQVNGDKQTEELARRIQRQEAETGEKVWRHIGPTAVEALGKAAREDENSRSEVLVRYLQDAEAAERNFEDALSTFSKGGDQREVQELMKMMSRKAKTQHERLEARLQALGADRSTAKSMLAHILAFPPTSAQMGHEESEKSAQHLMITCAAAGAEMGMYEALGRVAESLGDQETATLARRLQEEEREDHRMAFDLLPASARRAFEVVAARR